MASNFSTKCANYTTTIPSRCIAVVSGQAAVVNLTALFGEVWRDFGSQLFAWMVCTIVVWLIGVLLNFTLLCTLVRELLRRGKHSGSRVLITHQIGLDFLQVCAAPAVDIFTTYYLPTVRLRPFSPTECGLIRVPFMWLECVSHWSSCATAINCFVAVCFPFQYKKLCSPKSVITLMMLPWLIGGLLNIPYLDHFTGTFSAAPKWFRCSFVDPTHFAVSAFLYFGFIMPMLMVTVLYTVTCLKMTLGQPSSKYGNERVPENPDQGVARRLRKRFTVAKSLFVSAVCYDVLYLTNPVMSWLAPQLLGGSPLPRMWLRQVYNVGFFVTPRKEDISLRLFSSRLNLNAVGPSNHSDKGLVRASPPE
ncbi:hypothetical protein BV898_15211 [Hypsibius exemplaris]|uniref:G-protein coupled receptors family 1 profile domain-containing protein n=1 Tax=Hypsibius exemplaris TaxID=2072580 RepID=A0A9X6NAD0_HYPEX|nr:hypothetical protein BV898_15211 [Hypsibius exemplaris]